MNGVDEEGNTYWGSLTAKYNVPSSCTLSRGDKNVVQRIFVGEPLKIHVMYSNITIHQNFGAMEDVRFVR